MVDLVRDSFKLRAWDLEDFGRGQAAFLSEFRERHSFNIKWLSHRGAIPAVYEFHPKHWQDPKTGTWYFDPSNSVYMAAVQFACPELIMEHHKVTHIVDFTPGSGALAVAASGAMEYEGVAANDAHRDWLDSIVDRCVMYKAGHESGFAELLGGDAEFVEKASKYFAKNMLEAKRWLMPVSAEDDEEMEEDGEDDDDEEEW